MLSLLFGLPWAGAVPTDVLAALHDGRDIVVGRAAMRVVPSGKISGDGGICGTEPCWLGKNSRLSLDLRQPGERQSKHSQDSYASALVSGSTQHSNYKGSRGDLIDERILRVIRTLSPDAYFFAVERETTYEVVPTPPAISPSVLPRGQQPANLVIVWRRVGLSFLLHRVDLDLCPSWDDCKLGEPTFSTVETAALDAVRAKALGGPTLAALNARVTPPSAPTAAAPVCEIFEKDTCTPLDISDPRAAFAASPFPVFPSSEDWVLAASSQFRVREVGRIQGERVSQWVCGTPYRGRRCWRTLEAALDAVDRAEAQNPGYTLGMPRQEVLSVFNECMASQDPEDADAVIECILGEMTAGGYRMSNFPIPGEKPALVSFTSRAYRVPGAANPQDPPADGRQYITYPEPKNCDCLAVQAEACDQCRSTEDRCMKCHAECARDMPHEYAACQYESL